MTLVGYSDSEGSDEEDSILPEPKIASKTNKAGFGKVVESSGTKKIKVDLPSVKPDFRNGAERPAKRAKIGSGLSGFNSLLPAPKRTTENAKRQGLGSGVSLKTSGVAAFSREPVEPRFEAYGETSNVSGLEEQQAPSAPAAEGERIGTPDDGMKKVENPMRFKPLSVANKKKPKKPTSGTTDTAKVQPKPKELSKFKEAAAPSKPRVSLFSVSSDAHEHAALDGSQSYEPMLSQSNTLEDAYAAERYDEAAQAQVDPNSLDAVASDLNLSAADRRRLFGRGGQNAQAINITNFNMDNEYRKNEELRAAGEAVQHRAVRAVAPGKHSLQQLVNSASTQREALEDAWADGKRNKGEAGNKYGWGR